jgi:hypothetical protein
MYQGQFSASDGTGNYMCYAGGVRSSKKAVGGSNELIRDHSDRRNLCSRPLVLRLLNRAARPLAALGIFTWRVQVDPLHTTSVRIVGVYDDQATRCFFNR